MLLQLDFRTSQNNRADGKRATNVTTRRRPNLQFRHDDDDDHAQLEEGISDGRDLQPIERACMDDIGVCHSQGKETSVLDCSLYWTSHN